MSRATYEPLVGETIALGGPTEVSNPLVILVALPLALDLVLLPFTFPVDLVDLVSSRRTGASARRVDGLQREDLPEGEGEERVE